MIGLYIILGCITTVLSQQYHLETILQQENAQGAEGQYKFGFDSSSQQRQEVKGSDGVTRGSYSYIDDQGTLQHIAYSADGNGFHIHNPSLGASSKSGSDQSVSHQSQRPSGGSNSRVPATFGSNNQFSYQNKPFPQNNFEMTAGQDLNSYPLKNVYNTLEETRQPQAGYKSQTRDSTTPSNHRFNLIVPQRQLHVAPEFHAVKSPLPHTEIHVTRAQHLDALQKALGLQNGATKTSSMSHNNQYTQYQNDNVDSGNNRQLTILAAAEALRSLLNSQ